MNDWLYVGTGVDDNWKGVKPFYYNERNDALK